MTTEEWIHSHRWKWQGVIRLPVERGHGGGERFASRRRP